MTFRYDGHGHSRMSDGRDMPAKIVQTAVEKGVNILGLSDHDTVSGLPAFLRACEEINAQEKKILPIPSLEVTTTDGHLLVALPHLRDAQKFVHDFPLWKKPADARYVIEKSITDYRALCIFTHPEASFIDGISIQRIESLLSSLAPGLFPFIGIEINNWMAQVFFWKRKQTEQVIMKKNEIWGLAECACTDYHRAEHVGNYTTLMDMSRLSADAFVDAFVNRRMQQQLTQPTTGQRLSAYLFAVNAGTVKHLKKKLGFKSTTS